MVGGRDQGAKMSLEVRRQCLVSFIQNPFSKTGTKLRRLDEKSDKIVSFSG